MRSHSTQVRQWTAAIAVSLVPAIAAAAPPADPWARVPAAPTACYRSQDTYLEKASTVYYALEEDIQRIADENANAQQEETENQETDPFKMAQSMTQAMLDDPSKAQAMMQAASPEAVQQESELLNQYAMEREAMRQELDALHQRFKAATAKALVPNDAKFDALVRKVESQGGSFATGEGFSVPPWAMDEWAVILGEKNAVYTGTICPQWFGPTGQYTAWLKRYKDHYVQKELPVAKTSEERGVQVSAFSGRSSRASSAVLKAVKDYVNQTDKVFQQRWIGPFGIWPEGVMMKDLKGQAP